MILETAQILCTVSHKFGVKAPYKPAFHKHPCILWAGESLENWLWLKELGLELNNEYQHRYSCKKAHKSAIVIANLITPPIPSLGVTPFAQAMPDKYKVKGYPIKAYRNYYIDDKKNILKYTNRERPYWLINSKEKNKKDHSLFFLNSKKLHTTKNSQSKKPKL